MATLLQLKIEATDAARFRGHRLEWRDIDLMRSIGTCMCCNMVVIVNTRPLPNGIEIGGEAVALNCKEG